MSYRSSSGAATTALLSALRTTAFLAGADITDGPGLASTANPECLSVGYTGGTDEYAIEGTITPEGMAGTRDRENYDIHCSASVLNGDQDLAAARDRALALHGLVGDLLRADSTLGGAVLNASLSDWSLRGDQTNSGALARLRFTVNCDAYTIT